MSRSRSALPATIGALTLTLTLILNACTTGGGGTRPSASPGSPAPVGSAGASATTSAAAGEPVNLRYLVEQPEDPATLERLDKHLDDFEKANPGITVKVEGMPTDNMRTVLQTQLRSGAGPDVFNWGSGPGYAGALAKAGLLYDLTDAYAEHKWPIYGFAKDQVTFDGKVVGIPG